MRRAQSRQRRYSAPGDAGDPSLSLRCHRGKHPHGTHTHLQLFAQSAPTRGQAAHGGHSAQGGARPLRLRGGAERKLRLWGQTARAEPRPGRLPPTRCLCSLPRGSRTGRELLTPGHRGGETRCYPRELRTTVPTFVGDSPFRCDCQHRPSRAVEKVTSDPPSSNPPSNPKDRGHRGADPPGRLLWEAKPCR